MSDSMGLVSGLVEEMDPNLMEYALKKSLISRNKLAIILKDSNGQNQYCCVECPARYEEKEKLEFHLCMHNKEYRFLCGICGTGLKRKEHLDRHTMEHQQVRPHVCQTCGKGFKRKEHLNIHQSIHTDDKSQVCSLCNRSFHRKDHLQKHLQTHSKLFLEQNMYPVGEHELTQIKAEVMDEDEKPDILGEDMQCDIEERDSSQNSDSLSDPADVRTLDVHTDRPFVCQICFKSYKRKDHLKIHSWTHTKKDKVCTDCGKGFHKEEQLKAHMRVCIQVHLKQFQSDHAGDGDGSEDYNPMMEQDLLVERRRGHDPESRPHECIVCHRRFKRKQHLKVHANVHLKQKPHTVWCSLCTQGFHSNEDFEGHVCSHSSLEQNEEDLCQSTDAPQEAKKENSEPTESTTNAEIKVSNGVDAVDEPSYLMVRDERDIPVPQRVYVCRYCSKPFKRKDHYKIHLHIHTGVRSFFCQHCGKGFYRKDHLQKHSQVHSRVRPRKQVPDLLPLALVPRKEVKPEITIHAPSNTKLRVPLQIKVPYQVVMSNDDGEQRSVTIDPQTQSRQHEIFT
ncbi:unnamed protein product [Diatraea saccharalis]|uniref:C2H2-type domain-containing protein n=1 Tax=Diatraea saccharalis TaxID=40085 RepID=A0A9N9QZA9_9NEOP|nr:unnamed protein product [Diatraea saccharalis]